MKYIVCNTPGEFELKQKEVPKPEPGQALVKIKKVGICGTDLHAYQGNQAFFSYPRILGHELSGEVLEMNGPAQDLKKGDRVAILPYLNCQQCIACRQGKSNCCSKLQVLGVHTDGGMQEIIAVPSWLLLPANALSSEQVAVIEPLSIGAHAVRRANIVEGENVLVVGCGPIGIGIMRFAQLQGARVIAMDINQQRLDQVSRMLDLEHTVKAGEDALDRIRQLTDGAGCTAVFDATGHKKALESGVQFMAHGGRYILVGLYKDDLCFHHPSIHAREASILCSRNATLEDFEYVMQVLENDQFPVAAYITHRVAFEEMISHFDAWIRPETGVIKAMVSL